MCFSLLLAHGYITGGDSGDWLSTSHTPPAPPVSPAVQRVFHHQPRRPRRQLSVLSIASQLATTTVSLRLRTHKYTKMGKCYGFEPGCDGRSRNIESWCGPCSRAKRARGEKVVNRGSPITTDHSQSLKKRPLDRSAYEKGLCDRYALRCMSQCTQCLLQCMYSPFPALTR